MTPPDDEVRRLRERVAELEAEVGRQTDVISELQVGLINAGGDLAVAKNTGRRPAHKNRLRLTKRHVDELYSWCMYLGAGPTDWEEAGGDARAISQVIAKLSRIDGETVAPHPALPPSEKERG